MVVSDSGIQVVSVIFSSVHGSSAILLEGLAHGSGKLLSIASLVGLWALYFAGLAGCETVVLV